MDLEHDHPDSCSLESLQAKLRAVEPGVVLVEPWVLRRLAELERRDGGAALFPLPQIDGRRIARSRLLELGREQDLPLPEELPTANDLLLLPTPTDSLADRPGAELLRRYWRLLFRAECQAELRRRLASSVPSSAELQTRIERVGRTAFNEARFVLLREGRLAGDGDERDAYAQWAGLYLDLRYFRPDLLAVYFPALLQAGADPAVLADEIDTERLLLQTRPPGANDLAPPPDDAAAVPVANATTLGGHGLPRGRVARDARLALQLLARAGRAAALGNSVRAAILRTRVFRAAPHDRQVRDAAMQDLDALARRLVGAVDLPEQSAAEWHAALAPVLSRAAGGWWNREARLLYDLQRACVYHEREIYSVGVVEWLLEFGRRPLRRPQPNQRLALIVRALRSALSRLPRTHVPAAQRAKLGHLLHDALARAESRLRDAVRRPVRDALAAGSLRPQNLVERVAGLKLIEELLDVIAARGFLTMGHVRDALSRNELKLDDVRGVLPFLAGDQLLRIDRALARSLDGVYHRGEIYLRFFQRASSVLFATPWGRVLTRTVLLPLGGAYVILEALDHTLVLLLRKLTGWEWLRLSRPEEFFGEPLGRALSDNLPFVLLSLVLLGMLNWPRFRQACLRGLRWIGRGLYSTTVRSAVWIASRPFVRAIWNSRISRQLARYGSKPAVFAGVAWLLTPRATGAAGRWIVAGSAFAAASVLLNTRAGRAIERVLLAWVREVAARVTTDVLANLLRGIAHFFRRLLEAFDRALYAVDEWLRFRAGQRRATLLAKAALGVGWFFVAYFARFAVNLLVEPQVNPIKHFPVVTVSHKIVLPTVGVFASAFERLGVATMRARTLATGVVFVIPGIFGFLAWELRANWKLYRANRPRSLQPVQVGSHGETMARLLRPGFHSGTIPKLFARLRRAQDKRDRAGRTAERAEVRGHKQREAAEHVREAVRRFVERDFLALLGQHPAWCDAPVSLGRVDLAVTRVSVELPCPAIGAAPARLSFEQRAGWILARLDDAGWIARASEDRRRLMGGALLGFYKLAGVDLVAEQIEAAFAPQAVAFELSRERLTIWLERQFERSPLVLSVRDDSLWSAQIGRDPLFLRQLAVPWDAWVCLWEATDGGEVAAELATMPRVNVLPRWLVCGASRLHAHCD